MADATQTSRPRTLRAILFLLAVLTSPFLCCGAVQLMDALPASVLPPALDFTLNLFESQAHVENKTSETFYLTPITTTYGYPMVIAQNTAFRQRDIPLEPNASVVLQYDSADLPLAGIAVCRSDNDCRLMAVDNSGMYYLESYESLPPLEPDWLEAIQAHPLNNYSNGFISVLALVPLLLLAGWWYLGRLEKKQAG